MISIILQSAAALIMSLTQPNGDAIPDFSRVGYHQGDKEIPHYEVVRTIEAPADGSDASALIQKAINEAPAPGAILLKAGTYNVYHTILLNRSGIVLRGEGDATVIMDKSRADSLKKTKWEHYKGYSVIRMGSGNKREVEEDTKTLISEKYVPVGRMSFKLSSTKNFKVGDRIVIFRPGTEEWIHDIRMDRIPARSNTRQWKAKGYNMYWERTITGIKGKTISIDNPVVMGLDYNYGGGFVMKCYTERIEESGVENITFDTEFNPAVTKKSRSGKEYMADELHAWIAIRIDAAENCWVSGVTGKHFCNATVNIAKGAYLCTVQNCTSLEPISVITGMRRYAFHIAGGEACMVKDCLADDDRHGFPAAAMTAGPNVYLRCTMTRAHSDCGPHQRWASGFLYDNVTTDGFLGVTDGSNWGSGHGWRGANFVLWNCKAKTLGVQSPWVSAQNWCVGCTGEIGTKKKKDIVFENTQRSYDDGLQRPKGVFASYGTPVQPESLYEYQYKQRKNK